MFASSLTCRGSTLTDLGNIAEAIADHDKAIAILTRLVEQDGRDDMRGALGLSLINRAKALGKAGKVPTALVDYDRGIAIMTRVVEEDGVAELASLVTTARRDRERLLWRTGKKDEATSDLKYACDLVSNRGLSLIH